MGWAERQAEDLEREKEEVEELKVSSQELWQQLQEAKKLLERVAAVPAMGSYWGLLKEIKTFLEK